MSVNNNWKDNPNGETYTHGLSDGSQRSRIQKRMDSDILPHFKEKLKRELAGKEPTEAAPELTTQIETKGEGVPQTQNLEPQAVEEIKPEIELTNSEKFFAVHERFPKIPPKDGELSQVSENVFETSPTNRVLLPILLKQFFSHLLPFFDLRGCHEFKDYISVFSS